MKTAIEIAMDAPVKPLTLAKPKKTLYIDKADGLSEEEIEKIAKEHECTYIALFDSRKKDTVDNHSDGDGTA